MNTAVETLPVSETLEPADQDQLADVVRRCYEDETAIYPIGGATSLDYGLPASVPGIGLSLRNLVQLVDHPARDMTVTVEAGMTMAALAEELAQNGQWLPLDVPAAGQATVGGVVATNTNGPRRFGWGTVRDYVIGISAVDGRGTKFKGGGRVVKNVAGYDFCKLLTGSLGTLGVITQVTFRVKPVPERSAMLACAPANCDEAERLLAALVESRTSAAAVELLAGPAWDRDPILAGLSGRHPGGLALLVGLEGSELEVDWMVAELEKEWRQQGAAPTRIVNEPAVSGLWSRLAEFPVDGESPLVLKANVVPSGTTSFIDVARQADPQCSIQAHAGSGIVIVRLSEVPEALGRVLVGRLQPAAAASHGNVIVLSNSGGAEMTHQSRWGGIDTPFWLMTEVKRQFDPKNLLNPGRFVYQ